MEQGNINNQVLDQEQILQYSVRSSTIILERMIELKANNQRCTLRALLESLHGGIPILEQQTKMESLTSTIRRMVDYYVRYVDANGVIRKHEAEEEAQQRLIQLHMIWGKRRGIPEIKLKNNPNYLEMAGTSAGSGWREESANLADEILRDMNTEDDDVLGINDNPEEPAVLESDESDLPLWECALDPETLKLVNDAVLNPWWCGAE